MIINNILNKPLTFRVDANSKIGSGHIMRCIALAQEWKDIGGDVFFFSSCENNTISERLIEEGFKYIGLDSPFSEKEDIQNTISVLNKSSQNLWLVIDGYYFSAFFLQSIRDAGYKVFLFDDINHHSTVYADIILNQNIDAEKIKYNCSSDTKQLLGVEYVLLRKEFLSFKNHSRIIPEKANRIVVTMGGGDFGNVTLKIIKALNLINDPELDVIIVVGPSNEHMDSLIEELNQSLFKNDLRISVENMPEIMAWADLAITAGGSTCWELCFMGVPSLVVCSALNQKDVVNALHNRQIFESLGWREDLNIREISNKIQDLIKNRLQRLKMMNLSQKLIDGLGSQRVIKSIVSSSI